MLIFDTGLFVNSTVYILNFNKYLSYFYPIRIKKIVSEYHTLELTWNNGKLLLDSAFANYSYGNLHKVFQMAFKQSKLVVSPTANVLLLGLGGGSIIEILEYEYSFKGQITAIEIDKTVISLYRDVFASQHNTQLNIVEQDALNWVNNPTELGKFDLIICDLFIDLEMPEFMYSSSFYQKIKNKLNEKGTVYVNTIHSSEQKKFSASFFYPTFKQIEKLSLFDLNEVYVLKKT